MEISHLNKFGVYTATNAEKLPILIFPTSHPKFLS